MLCYIVNILIQCYFLSGLMLKCHSLTHSPLQAREDKRYIDKTPTASGHQQGHFISPHFTSPVVCPQIITLITPGIVHVHCQVCLSSYVSLSLSFSLSLSLSLSFCMYIFIYQSIAVCMEATQLYNLMHRYHWDEVECTSTESGILGNTSRLPVIE